MEIFPDGLLRHPPETNGYKVLVGPQMAGSRSSTSSLRGVPVKLLLHRVSTSPLTSPSRPPNTTAETRLSLVALRAWTRLQSHPFGRRPGQPDAPGPVHPTRRSGGGGPCSCMRLPYCSPLGISWGSTPHSSSQSAPHSRETAANASSISLPGGTVGWLWNVRLEQGSRATLTPSPRARSSANSDNGAAQRSIITMA